MKKLMMIVVALLSIKVYLEKKGLQHAKEYYQQESERARKELF